MSKRIRIKPDGEIVFIYRDDLSHLHRFLRSEVIDRRASHVEPDPDNPGCFVVDLTPSGGPIVKSHPITGQVFEKRGDALKFEEEWLIQQGKA